MTGCLPTQALAFLAVFVYATHATQATEWKPGLIHRFELTNNDTEVVVDARTTVITVTDSFVKYHRNVR